ncbi:hypothetical protein ACW14Y_14345 [Kitasatospora sp. cg17-2]
MSAHTVATARRTAPASWTALRRFLALDAVVSGGNGLAYLAFSGPLAELLGVGRSTLLELGAVLAAFGLAVGLLAARPQPSRTAVRAVIDINLGWTVLSLVAMELWFEPTTAGYVWIPLQAASVAGFAVLQFTTLRRVPA